ncbi:MAG: GNAT family N-acetyltransferase [Actinomycetota bacterium]|nr:GNAT family N-acetyltransferase [Actinomycetota bacterium]
MPLSAPQLRTARPIDRTALRSLHAAALAELSENRGGARLAAYLPEPDELGAGPDGPAATLRCVLVGLLDGEVVGTASASCNHSPGPAGVATLDLLFVDRAARRRGVGSLLLGGVRSWARDRGCGGIDAPALPGDRATKSLFEAAGMRARLLILHGDL